MICKDCLHFWCSKHRPKEADCYKGDVDEEQECCDYFQQNEDDEEAWLEREPDFDDDPCEVEPDVCDRYYDGR